MEMADAGESEAAMQADRNTIVRIDAGDHDMLAHAGGAHHERGKQCSADALTAAVRANVDAVLDTVPVSRPRPKLAEGAESGDARSIPRHDHWKAMFHLGVEPRRAAGLGELQFG